jgi:hypothetical protein
MNPTHFQIAEQREREKIQELFNNYLSKHRCSNLILSAPGTYSPVDYFFISAGTQLIAAEQKIRDISYKKYTDCLIEFNKFEKLYDFHKAGCTTLYLVIYHELTAVFNLSKIYNDEQGFLEYPLNYNFINYNCTKNMQDYQHGQSEKLLRFLPLYSADFFITNDFKQITFSDLYK